MTKKNLQTEAKITVEEAIAQVAMKFGQESIMLLGQRQNAAATVFSSGSLTIDHALGIGGYPRGRIIEIYGPESSGKTTLSLHAIAEVQKLGGTAAFIDAEHAIDPKYAQALGVDIKRLILSQPDSGEQALEIVDILTRTGAIDLIVVDSVAALVPEVELKGEMRDQTIGAQARLMSKALRKITASLNKTATTIIFINQIRMKIGVMFGNPETTPGGRSLKFYASIRLEIRSQALLKNGERIMGNLIKVKVVKNKLAPPYRTALSEIIFSKGLSRESEIIMLALQFKIIQQAGSWYQYATKNLAQGKNNLRLRLEQEPALAQEIVAKIKTLQNQQLKQGTKKD